MNINNKTQFTRLRTIFGFEKDKDYLAWCKEKFPNQDLHHILSSFLSKKMTDYLIYPVDHEFHLGVVENNKAEYCVKYFNLSVNILLRYAKEKFDLYYDNLPIEAETGLYEPKKVNELIKEIARIKCQQNLKT